MSTSTLTCASRNIMFSVMVIVVVLQSIVPSTTAQLSFSTGWGHGKRSSAPAMSAGDLSKSSGSLVCTSSYANDIFHLRLQQLVQEEVSRQEACSRT